MQETLTLKPANSGGYRAYWSNGALLGEIYREIDGYYVWWPTSSGGCWNSHALKEIAAALDRLNAECDQEVRRAMPTTDPIAGRNYVPFTGDKQEIPFDI